MLRLFLCSLLLWHAAGALDDASLEVITSFIESERGQPFWAVDSSETRYDTASALWAAKPGSSAMQADSATFWRGKEATFDGITGLGSDPSATAADLQHTASLVSRVLPVPSGPEAEQQLLCLNVCSGIGREAAGGLLPGGCTSLDLVEEQGHLMAAALAALPEGAVGQAHTGAAQHFDFQQGRLYHAVFIGWCSQFFPDEQLLQLLRRASAALAPGGALIIKDNVSLGADAVYSDQGNHVIRSSAYFNALVSMADSSLLRLLEEPCPEWPEGYFPYRAIVWGKGGEWTEEARERLAAPASAESDDGAEGEL
jgi:hypothetical protein